MTQELKQKVDNLLLEVERILHGEYRSFIKYALIVKVARETINDLQAILTHRTFPSKEQEIEYFKHIHPTAIQCCIYYSLLCRYEVRMLRQCTIKDRKQQCKMLLNQIRKYYKEYGEIISYYRLGSTHLDENFFLRNTHPMPFLMEECLAYVNLNYCTGFDIIIGRYIALEKFKAYLEMELFRLSKPPGNHNLITSCENEKRLPWYDQKVDIVELAYALYYACFKDRNNVNLEDVLHALSTAFNVKIEDASRKFIDIKNRSNPTKFIDSLRKSLISEIEKDLE